MSQRRRLCSGVFCGIHPDSKTEVHSASVWVTADEHFDVRMKLHDFS